MPLFYVTGDGLLHKTFQDETGNAIFKYEEQQMPSPNSGEPRQRCIMANATTDTKYGFIDFVTRIPVGVVVDSKAYIDLWDLLGKAYVEKDEVIYRSPKGYKWIVGPENIKLYLRGKTANQAPIVDFTRYVPGRGNHFSDTIFISEDLHGISLGEILAGWILMERVRALKYQLKTIPANRAPLDKWDKLRFRLVAVMQSLTLPRVTQIHRKPKSRRSRSAVFSSQKRRSLLLTAGEPEETGEEAGSPSQTQVQAQALELSSRIFSRSELAVRRGVPLGRQILRLIGQVW